MKLGGFGKSFNFNLGGIADFKGANDFVIAGVTNSKTAKKTDSHKKASVKSQDYGYTGYGYGSEASYGSGLSYGMGNNLGYGYGLGYGD